MDTGLLTVSVVAVGLMETEVCTGFVSSIHGEFDFYSANVAPRARLTSGSALV